MQFFKRSPLFTLLLTLTVFTNCTSNEIGESKDVNQDKIYQQYAVSYTEGNATVSVKAQFRFAGRNGTTLVLNKPSQLSFDGELIKVDSGSASGAFYQLYKPVSGFYGTHHFIFSTINEKKFDNDFNFEPFKLINTPATVDKKSAFTLLFETTPLKNDDYIEVRSIGTDSSFSITIGSGEKGNSITIPVKELKRQKGKELMLEARLYRKIPLQENTAEGGILEIKQSLKTIRISLAD